MSDYYDYEDAYVLAESLPYDNVFIAPHFGSFYRALKNRKYDIIIATLPPSEDSVVLEAAGKPLRYYLGVFDVDLDANSPCTDHVKLALKPVAHLNAKGKMLPIYAVELGRKLVVVMPDVTHAEGCIKKNEKTLKLLISMLKSIYEAGKVSNVHAETIKSILASISLPTMIIPLNAMCGDGVGIRITKEGDLRITLSGKTEIKEFSMKNKIYKLEIEEKPIFHYKIYVDYKITDKSLKPQNVTAEWKDTYVEYQGKEHCHENIRDDKRNTEVCLGSYNLPEPQLNEINDLCKFATNLAKDVIRVLSVPNISSAFQSCIVTKLAESNKSGGAGEWEVRA